MNPSEQGYKKAVGDGKDMSTATDKVTKKVPKFTFVSRIRGARDVHKMTASEFAQKVQNRRGPDRKGDPSFTLQEHFNGDTMVHPYYDYDAKYKEPFATDEAREIEEKIRLEDFKSLIAQLHPGAEVVYGQRHGPLAPKDKETDTSDYAWKISYRAWVQEIKIKVRDIARHARRTLKLSAKDVHPYLDLSVYKDKEQLLGVIYGCKDIDEIKRYLVPLDKTEPLTKFLAQNVDEADKLLTIDAPQGGIEEAVTKSAKRGRPKKDALAAPRSAAPTPQTGNVTEVSELSEIGERILQRPEYDSVLTDASDFFGSKYRMQEDLVKIIVKQEYRALIFPTVKKWCYIGLLQKDGKTVHTGNNAYITVTEAGARFKCHDEDHKTVDLKCIGFSELPASLQKVFNDEFYKNKLEDSLMVEALEDCKGTIVGTYPYENELNPEQALTKFRTKSVMTACMYCKERQITYEHEGTRWWLQCENPKCGMKWPPPGGFDIGNEHTKLLAALSQLQVQLNIGTVNVVGNIVNTVNNFHSSEIEFYSDFTMDEIAEFEDVHENQLFVESLQGTDMTVSQFATYHFRNRFHCTSDKKWYEYRGHCWSEDAAELAYKEAMGEKAFCYHYHHMALRFENAPIQTDEVKRKARQLRKLCVSLEDGKFRERIVTDSIMKFHRMRPFFMRDLNTQNIMVFQDGVYDFNTGTFGPGSPDVPVTMSVPQNYYPFDGENEQVKFLMKFMSDILPDPDVRDYTLKVLGICLTQEVLQYFFIWTGSGGNGKGRLVRLMEECLGPYYQTVSPTMLTRKREDANQANEALMSLVTARLAVFQEAESSDTIQCGILKGMTGGDTMSSRQNYGRQVKFRPTFKSLFVCNDLPNMSENTWGLWRRVRCVNFPTRFVENPVQLNERQIDYELDEKLRTAAPYFIGVLIEYFRRYKAGKLSEPALVRQITDKYRETQDVVKEFIAEHMVKEESEDVLLAWTELRSAYIRINKKPPPFDKVKSQAWNAFTEAGLHYTSTFVPTYHNNEKKFRGFRGWSLRDT